MEPIRRIAGVESGEAAVAADALQPGVDRPFELEGAIVLELAKRVLRIDRQALELQRAQARVEAEDRRRHRRQEPLAGGEDRRRGPDEGARRARRRDVDVLPARAHEAAVRSLEPDVRIARREHQRVLIGMDRRRLGEEVRRVAVRRAAVEGQVREGDQVVVGIRLPCRRRAQDAARIRETVRLVVVVRADDEYRVGPAGRRIDAHVVPALAGAELEGGEARVAHRGAGEKLPTARSRRLAAGNHRRLLGDERRRRPARVVDAPDLAERGQRRREAVERAGRACRRVDAELAAGKLREHEVRAVGTDVRLVLAEEDLREPAGLLRAPDADVDRGSIDDARIGGIEGDLVDAPRGQAGIPERGAGNAAAVPDLRERRAAVGRLVEAGRSLVRREDPAFGSADAAHAERGRDEERAGAVGIEDDACD